VVVTTGLLHEQAMMPEKALSQMSAQNMLKAFEVNAMGPALVMKHFLPLFPKDGRAVFAVMSAKVGSISENNLGGWHSHRAAKAALNQFVKTAAVELKRRNPEALCVSIYPGTVRSKLSEPFSKSALNVREPDVAAAEILAAIESLKPEHTGGFFDYTGASIAF
jgi:NAD(P)-dependent dehydrogenase (short-subunit alcohol dehydrogenase family)